MQIIHKTRHGDWMNQRDPGFELAGYPPYSGQVHGRDTDSWIFENYSLGLNPNRDAWANWFTASSRRVIHEKMSAMIAFYNNELDRYAANYLGDKNR